jgi:hypothetical protein
VGSRRARRREHRRGGSSFVEGLTSAGAAVGVLLTVSHQAHNHAKARPCPAHAQPGACLGHAFGAAITPYIVGGLAGAVIGLLAGVLIVALRRAIMPSRSPSTSKVRSGFVPRDPVTRDPARRAASQPQSAVPDLTKPELHALRLKVRQSVLAAMRELNSGGKRDDILSRARSTGGFTTRELHAPAPRRDQARYSRQIDHDLSWALTDLKRDGLATNPARGIWRLTESAMLEPVADLVVPDRLAELRGMPYDEYLRTPEWKQTRAAALVRAEHRCALDPEHAGQLDVHHRYYERRGAELPSDLIVLCHACHRLHHAQNGLPG